MNPDRSNPRCLLGTLAVTIAFALVFCLQHTLVVCRGPQRDAHLELAHAATGCCAHEHGAAGNDADQCCGPERHGGNELPAIRCGGCVDTPVSLPTGPLPSRVSVASEAADAAECWWPTCRGSSGDATAVGTRPPPMRPPRPDEPLRRRRSVVLVV